MEGGGLHVVPRNNPIPLIVPWRGEGVGRIGKTLTNPLKPGTIFPLLFYWCQGAVQLLFSCYAYSFSLHHTLTNPISRAECYLGGNPGMGWPRRILAWFVVFGEAFPPAELFLAAACWIFLHFSVRTLSVSVKVGHNFGTPCMEAISDKKKKLFAY